MGEGRQEIVLNVVHACPGHIAIGLLVVGARHTDDKRCADACFPPSLVRGDFLLLGWVGWFGSLRSGSDTLKGG